MERRRRLRERVIDIEVLGLALAFLTRGMGHRYDAFGCTIGKWPR